MNYINLANSPIDMLKCHETFKQMTFNQKLEGALYIVLLGMGIVFLALVIIMFSSMIMSKFLNKAGKKSKASINVPETDIVATADSPYAQAASHKKFSNAESNNNSVVDMESESELVAVIMAAIAQSSNNQSDIVVSRIRRINGASAWNMAGVSETMNKNL